MELIEKLNRKYKPNTPIFINEIYALMSDYSRPRIYQFISEAVKNNLLFRFENGIYYIPTKTLLGYSKLNPQKVIEKKYIASDNNVFGIYGGIQLMSAMGLTDQVPVVIEVLTNNESMRYREVEIGYLKIILRKARMVIDANNVDAFTVLELFNSLNPSIMQKEIDYGKVVSYIQSKNLHVNDLISYSQYFPAKAVKNLVSSGVLNAII